jgi:hypothetical protein
VQLADAGNCAEAIDKLERAETLYHAPTILGRLGECQVAVGRVVAGTENLQRVVREALPARAPKAFVDAQARAKKVLEEALPKLARLRIHVDAPPGAKMTVKVDGEVVSLAALDVDRPTDPGAHHVEVLAPGFRPALADIVIEQGSSAAVTLRLEPDPNGAGVPPGSAAPWQGAPGAVPGPNGPTYPNAPASPEETKGPSKTLGYVLLGVGGAGVIVGSAFGVSALGKKSTLNSACGPSKTACPSSSQGDIDGLKSAATLSTIGLVVGGLGLGAGLLVLVLSQPSTTGLREAPRVAIHPVLGPRSIGLTGSF